jgi:tetratricopeptide (TPR) repeat protein
LAQAAFRASGRKDLDGAITAIERALKEVEERSDEAPVLSGLSRDEQARHAEALVKDADGGAPDRAQRYEDAANLYFKLWKEHGEAACRDKQPACEHNDKILYNAARAYQAARLMGKAVMVRQVLLNQEFGLVDTEAARRAAWEIGSIHLALANFLEAAEAYEQFAATVASAPAQEWQDRAATALSDAIVLRLGLGDPEKAAADADLFAKRFGHKEPAKDAQIVFAIGAYHAERQDWASAEKALAAAMGKIDKHATVDVRLQAHAFLGRSYAALKKDAQAEKEHHTVRDGFEDQEVIKQLESGGGARAERDRRLGKTLTAVGEALFFFAEKKRDALKQIEFPIYRGKPDDQKEIAAFVDTKIADWFKKKEMAVRSAQEEYLRITQLKPVPPPMWIIRAAAAVGSMWAELAEEILRVPYPKKWDGPGNVPGVTPPMPWRELKSSYQARLKDILEKQGATRAARLAFQACMDHAIKFQHLDAIADGCKQWLAKSFPGQVVVLAEIRDGARHRRSVLDAAPLPVAYDGGTVVDGREDALVVLAALQMMRNSAGDAAGVVANLRRALALDDGFLPAHELLVTVYLASSDKAGRSLDVADLVCSRALRKEPNNAQVHNTCGLVAMAKGETARATQSFAMTRRLDPGSFEARMNFAAVHLGFGGFKEAESAYTEALAIRPHDYDAQLGLAVALRGMIVDANDQAQVAKVQSALDAARKIDPDRPETNFNEALLTDQIKARDGSRDAMSKATRLYRDFAHVVGKLPRPEWAEAVKLAKERIAKLDAQLGTAPAP